MLILEMISWIPNYLSSLPLHSQLAKTIRQKIDSNVLQCGHVLPTAAYTSAKLGISAHVVKCAYSELQESSFGNILANGTFMINAQKPFINPNLFFTENPSSENTSY